MGRTKVNLKKLHAALLIQACYRRRLVQKELHRRKKMLNKRRNVSKEILSTEREYVTNLNVLVESFFKPLQQPHNMKHLDDVLSKEFSSSLSGIEVILQFHLSLLADLEKVIQSWSTNTKLGELFEPMALYLKFYSQYVTHYQTVVQLLAKRKTDKNLQHLLESLKPESRGKGIKDYMIMPIQRIPRYQMLLSELIKSTWEDHSDYINLEAAHKKVKTVAETLENQSADALSITKVMELASSFQFDKNNFKIVVPHRRYIAEDDALFVTDGSPIAVKIFLFNDLVILGKSKKDRFKIVGKAKLVPETTTCTFDTPASIGSKLVTATESNILFTIHSQFENDLKFVVSPKSEKKWENDISSLLHGERIWLPHEEKQKKKHAAIVQSPAFQISGTATLSKKRSRISGISTFLSSLKEDMKEKDKNKSKEMKTLALEQLSQSTPERARTPTEIVSARVDDKINVVHRSSSFEPSKLDQHLNPQPISPRKRKHGGLGDSITDDESITTLRSSLYYDVYEEQSVPLDDDEEDEDEISVSRQKTKRKRKVKSIRVSDVDESTNAVRENTKRKRKKHRTTDLTGKLGSQDQLKKKSNRAIVFESGSESIDDKPLKKDIKKPVTSADDYDITATKRANFRKSLAASRSEHSKQSPYTPEGYRSKKQKSQQS